MLVLELVIIIKQLIHVTEGTTTLKILNLHALGGFNPAASDELTFAFSYAAVAS